MMSKVAANLSFADGFDRCISFGDHADHPSPFPSPSSSPSSLAWSEINLCAAYID